MGSYDHGKGFVPETGNSSTYGVSKLHTLSSADKGYEPVIYGYKSSV